DVDGPRGLAVAEPDAEVGVGALAEPAGGEGGLGRRVAAGGEGVRVGVAHRGEGAGAPAYGGVDTPPAKAGGFFLHPQPPPLTRASGGLTPSPEADTVCPTARMFFAAFTSR